MKYLILICCPFLLYGQDPSDIDTAFQVFKGILTATGFDLYLKALLAGLFVVVSIAVWWIKIFHSKEVREQAAFEEAQRIKKEQDVNNTRVMSDAIKAFQAGIDSVYAQDYKFYQDWLTQKEYYKIMMKVPDAKQPLLAAFLYNETIPVTDRAARIIMVVKQK